MIRGTTPTHIFTLPFDTSSIAEVRVIYAQDDNEVFVKSTDDCVLAGYTLRVKLTQEDTFKLSSSSAVQVQLRVLTTEGEAMSSEVMRMSVGKCLSEEVLV